MEASVSATKVGMDDQLQLTLSVHGDTLGRAGSPKLPKLEGFRLAGQSQSTSIQWVNGRMSAIRAIIYTLLPQSEGKHRIGPISVSYSGKEYLTDPIEVEVVSGSVESRPGTSGSDPFDLFTPFRSRRPAAQGELFVTSELSRKTAYVGEQVLLTYKLHTQVPVMGLEVDRQPKLTGFWVEEIPMPREPPWQKETVDGKEFYVFEVKKSVLFPTRAGSITIEPALFSMAVRASTDPFDSFFFQSSQPVRRSSKPLTLTVKPLPAEGRPRDFSGAVGHFELEAKLDKSRLEAGNPLTLRLTLKGKGNLKTIEPPGLPPLVDFKTYEPKVEDRLRADDSGFGGEKRWEYVLVPHSAGKHRLGPLRFSYFDPGKETYLHLETEPLSLEVGRPVAMAGAPVAVPRSEVKLLRRDVRYLKPSPVRLGAPPARFHRSTFFYASLALPILWNLALVAYRWKREKEAAEVGLWRRRRARRMARGRLRLAAKRLQPGGKDFYEVAAGALYRYVADKLDVGASSLTSQQIETMLAGRQVPEPVRAEFLQAIAACEFARFTPGERTREEMESLLGQAERAIVSLERHLG